LATARKLKVELKLFVEVRKVEPIRVLIADDHPVVREGLSAMLGKRGWSQDISS
jgi:hypothetical protein